jgi:hypothetical protein
MARDTAGIFHDKTDGRSLGAWLTVVTLNTRGIPVTGSRLAARYQAIAKALEVSDADVVAFQEVFTYWHLRGRREYLSDHVGLYARLLQGPD